MKRVHVLVRAERHVFCYRVVLVGAGNSWSIKSVELVGVDRGRPTTEEKTSYGFKWLSQGEWWQNFLEAVEARMS